MKFKLLSIIFISIIKLSSINAQCTNGTQDICKCSTAPVLCTIDELDGYVLPMSNYQHPWDGPNPLCAGQGGVPNNPSWFAFKAWCTDLTLICSVSNCTGQGGSNGIQIAIYSSCSPYTPVACNVSPANCNLNDKTITMTGLVIGATYYFLVDGCAGSYCTVTIDVVGTCGNPVIQDWKGPISGPKEICAPKTNVYTIQKVDGATHYVWYLNGVVIKNSTANNVSVAWAAPGVYTLCVDAYNNPCIPESDPPPPTCIDITVDVANAGTLTVTPQNLCPGKIVDYNVVGFTPAPNNAEYILIANSSGVVIEVLTNTSGTWTYDKCGTFTFYSYNYVISGNSTIPTVGMNISSINCVVNCCDLKSKVVTFADSQKPVISGKPANQTLTCYDLLQPMADLSYTDNCIGPGTIPGVETGSANMCNGGTITRTWMVKDSCNNTDSHVQTITIQGSPIPTWTNPLANQTIICADIPTTHPDLAYTNNKSGGCQIAGTVAPVVTGSADLCGGAITRTWSFTDFCGRTITHAQVLTVTPVAQANWVNPPPTAITVSCANIPTSAPDLSYTNNLISACAITGSVPAVVTGSADLCGGVITYTWTFIDVCGRTITRVQTITATQVAQAAFINPPASQTVTCANIPTSAPDLNYTNNLSGACGITGVVSPVQSGSADLCGGSIVYTWTYTDACGRITNHAQVFTVTPVPQATFTNPPPSQTVSCANIPTSAPDLQITNNLAGPCAITATVSPIQSGNADLCGGSISYTWTYTDPCGRTTTHAQTFTATIVPQATFVSPPPSQTVTCENIPASAPDLQYSNGLAGACAIQGSKSAFQSGNADLCGGTITFTWTLIDVCGRNTTHVQNYTVTPTPIAAFVSPPANQTVTCQNIPTSAPDIAYTNGKFGNCAIQGTVSAQQSGFADLCGGSINFTWAFTDQCGRLITHTQTYTVIPVPLATFLNPPADGKVACDMVNNNPPPLNYTNGIAGNCGIMGAVSAQLFPNYTECGGDISYIWEFTDQCGRQITHLQVITVDPAPAAKFQNIPPDITVTCANVPNPDLPIIYDNAKTAPCGINGSVLPLESGIIDGCGGILIHEYEFIDDCGRSLTHNRKITVQPATPPGYINAPKDITITCEEADMFDFNTSLIYDNNLTGLCALNGSADGNPSGSYNYCGGIISITWQEDICNKPLKHVQKVTVLPAPDPTFFNPPVDVTLSCGAPFPPVPELYYSNNKAGDCLIEGFTNASSFINNFIQTNTWEITQPCSGKKIKHVQKVYGIPSPDLTLSPFSKSICKGESYDLKSIAVTDKNNTNPSISYHSGSPATPSNKLSSTIVSPNTTTIYYILAVNNANCSDEEPFSVFVDNPNSAGNNGGGSICFGATGVNLNTYLSGSFFTPGSWLDINNAGINLSNPANVGFKNLAANTYPIGYIVPANGACKPDTSIINIALQPEILIDVQGIICTPDLQNYNVTIDGNGYTITSSIGSIGSPIGTIYSIGPIPVDSSLTITAIDQSTGCSNSFVINPPNCNCPQVDPPISLGDKIICQGAPIPTLSVTVNVDETANWYSSAFGGSLLQANSLTYLPPVSAPGLYVYYAEAKNINFTNCVSLTRTPVSLEIVAKPLVTNASLFNCNENGNGNASFDLLNAQLLISTESNVNFTFHLSNSDALAGINPLSSPFTNTLTPTQTLFVSVKNSINCQSIATLTLNIYPKIVINQTIKPETCFGDGDGSITVNTTGGTGSVGLSLDGIIYGSNNLFSPLTPGNYTIYAQDTAGCLINKNVAVADGLKINLADFLLVCNDNGTDSDNSDDFYTITFKLTNNKANAGTYTVKSGNTPQGTFNYNTTQSFTLPAQGQSTLLSFEDATTKCEITQAIGPLISCSTNCKIDFITLTKVCNNAGTDTDPIDDFYTLTINANVQNGGASNTFNVVIGGSTIATFTFGVGGTITLPANSANVLITLIDADNPLCQSSKATGALNPCSSTCLVLPELITIVCDDKGTVNDPTDDTFTFELAVNGVNNSSKWYLATATTILFDYIDTLTFGPYLISNGNIDMQLIDQVDKNCFAFFTVDAPVPCSVPCILNVSNLTIGLCEDNNTGPTAADDVFDVSFVINAPSGNVTKYIITNGAQNWGPFDYGQLITLDNLPASGSVINLIVSDPNNTGCSLTIPVQQDPCSICDQTVDAGPGIKLDCIIKDYTLKATSSKPGNYQWSGPNLFNSNILQPLVNVPGVYTLLVTYSNQCTATDNVTITLDSSVPVANAGPDQILNCQITQVTLDGSGSSGNPSVVYEWRDTNGNLLGTGKTYITSTPGAYFLTLVDQASNCTSPPSLVTVFSYDIKPDPAIFAKPDEILNCKVDVITLNGLPQADVIYTWTFNGVTTISINFVITLPGTVTLTVFDTLSKCESTNFIVIQELIEYPLVNIAPALDFTCKTTSMVLDASSSQDGPGITYQWYGSNFTPIQGATADKLTITVAGTYYFEAFDPNNGCTNVDTISVNTNFLLPNISSGNDINLPCLETKTQLNGKILNGTSSYTYQWSSTIGTILSGGNTLKPLVDGQANYVLVVTDAINGCTSKDTVFVNSSSGVPKIDALKIDSIKCFNQDNGKIEILGVSGGTPPYKFEVNGKIFNSTSFSPLKPNTYVIKVIDANECEGDTIITLLEGKKFEINLPKSISLSIADTGVIEAFIDIPLSEISKIIWTPSDNLSCDSCLITRVIALGEQLYQITIVDKDGCEAKNVILVLVKKDIKIFVPNVFSPNNDQLNDFFTIFSDDRVVNIDLLEIFDRWGERMFRREDFKTNVENLGWDGMFREQPAATGVYVYYFTVTYIDGSKETFKGGITLLR